MIGEGRFASIFRVRLFGEGVVARRSSRALAVAWFGLRLRRFDLVGEAGADLVGDGNKSNFSLFKNCH